MNAKSRNRVLVRKKIPDFYKDMLPNMDPPPLPPDLHRNGAWGGILRSFDRRGIAPPTVERLRRAVGVDTHNRTFFLFNTNIRL